MGLIFGSILFGAALGLFVINKVVFEKETSKMEFALYGFNLGLALSLFLIELDKLI